MYPFSVDVSEGSAVGHTGSSHKHISCHIVHFSVQPLNTKHTQLDTQNTCVGHRGLLWSTTSLVVLGS